MSARKLSRLAGLVFVLSAILGGVSAAPEAAQHETGGTSAAATTAAAPLLFGDIIWA